MLQTSSPEPLLLLTVLEGEREVEVELHALFSSSRIRGEWFERSDEILDFIEESAMYHVIKDARANGVYVEKVVDDLWLSSKTGTVDSPE